MITTPITLDILRGAVELEHTGTGVLVHRLPAWARAQCSDPQLLQAQAQPTGVRLAFRTSARVLELDALPTRRVFLGVPPAPVGVFELVVDGRLVAAATVPGGNTVLVDLAGGSGSTELGKVGTLRFDLPAGVKDVALWLPHSEVTELVALRTDAPVFALPDPGRVWLHHGSSISHGSNAVTPTGTWPAVAAAGGGVELVNLGLRGSALLDPFTARTMRDLPADLISIKIGINLCNLDLMRLRAFGPAVHGFLDTIRDGHPETPLLVVSPIFCLIHEDTPGPGGFDVEALRTGRLRFVASGDPAGVATGSLTLRVIREQLAAIVEQRRAADSNLHYLDGLRLYGAGDAQRLPLPDQLHPDPETHQLIGQRFAELVFAGSDFPGW